MLNYQRISKQFPNSFQTYFKRIKIHQAILQDDLRCSNHPCFAFRNNWGFGGSRLVVTARVGQDQLRSFAGSGAVGTPVSPWWVTVNLWGQAWTVTQKKASDFASPTVSPVRYLVLVFQNWGLVAWRMGAGKLYDSMTGEVELAQWSMFFNGKPVDLKLLVVFDTIQLWVSKIWAVSFICFKPCVFFTWSEDILRMMKSMFLDGHDMMKARWHSLPHYAGGSSEASGRPTANSRGRQGQEVCWVCSGGPKNRMNRIP